MRRFRILGCACLIFFWLFTASAQKRRAAAPYSAPHITGKFIDSDGLRRLTLQYQHNSRPEAFTGTLQATCMLPARSKSTPSKPLDLSAIPIGTSMTVFYVSRAQKAKPDKQPENIILALRFDRVRSGSTLPQGVPIPCFKAAETPAPK